MKRAWKGYALIAPMLAGFLLFYVVPFGQVMWDSLSQGTGKSQLFVGFYNYQRMFQNKMFLTAFGNTLKFLGLGLPLVLLLAYGLALFLKSRARRSPVLRGVFLVGGEHPHESVYMLQHFLNNSFESLNYQRLSVASVLLFLVIALGLGLCALWVLRKEAARS